MHPRSEPYRIPEGASASSVGFQPFTMRGLGRDGHRASGAGQVCCHGYVGLAGHGALRLVSRCFSSTLTPVRLVDEGMGTQRRSTAEAAAGQGDRFRSRHPVSGLFFR